MFAFDLQSVEPSLIMNTHTRM